MVAASNLNQGPKPQPLKILTIDGGGLQAISTLLILNRLLETIGKQNCKPPKKPRKPRPCDVFDTIAGIGAGGWLAILLGRFRMDITSCLSEWYKITRCIEPQSKSDELRLRLLHHSYYNLDRLTEEIDRLTEMYGTGESLLEEDPEGARTRHVFVAALKSDKSDAKGYRLFRTYEPPKSTKLPKKLLPGPKNPKDYKISSAFAVTGAAKYFTKEWHEDIEQSGRTKFFDRKFPRPHNITELALDEMWAIYGTDVALSVVINIGPGLPSNLDFARIARRFSWGRSPLGSSRTVSSKEVKPSTTKQGMANPGDRDSTFVTQLDGPDSSRDPSAHLRFDASRPNPAADGEPKRAMKRFNTFGSMGRPMDEKLRRDEDEIERSIRVKLNNMRPGDAALYYRLAPPVAAQGTAQNDSSASLVAHDATMNYLDQPKIVTTIDDVAETARDGVSFV